MEQLGLNLGYLLVQVFSFLIMLVVLRAWAFRPIINMLDKRRESIAKGLEDAQLAADARQNAEKDAEKIIAEAQSQASQIVREATERAEEAARDVKTTAEADVVSIREVAQADAEGERNRVLGDLRSHVASLAIAAAQKVIGDALDEKRQHALIEGFFSGVKAGKITVLEGAEISGASAEVTSALPLNKNEQDAVKKDVLSRLGGEASVTFRVDPNILGGLVVRVGDKVLDGSVAGNLESLRQNLR